VINPAFPDEQSPDQPRDKAANLKIKAANLRM
jgi:hypothetical protein